MILSYFLGVLKVNGIKIKLFQKIIRNINCSSGLFMLELSEGCAGSIGIRTRDILKKCIFQRKTCV